MKLVDSNVFSRVCLSVRWRGGLNMITTNYAIGQYRSPETSPPLPLTIQGPSALSTPSRHVQTCSPGPLPESSLPVATTSFIQLNSFINWKYDPRTLTLVAAGRSYVRHVTMACVKSDTKQ